MNKLNLILFAALVSFAACKDSKSAEGTTDTTTTDAPAESTIAVGENTTPATVVNPDGTTPSEVMSEPSAISAVPTGPITTVEFTETVYDYGTVKDGEKVKHSYKFKNTGKEPLIISDAKGSCGCTVPDWPREPIAPGKTGEIKVEFDSKNKGTVEGSNQSKRVTITANTDPAQSYLTIKGIVKKDKEAATK